MSDCKKVVRWALRDAADGTWLEEEHEGWSTDKSKRRLFDKLEDLCEIIGAHAIPPEFDLRIVRVTTKKVAAGAAYKRGREDMRAEIVRALDCAGLPYSVRIAGDV